MFWHTGNLPVPDREELRINQCLKCAPIKEDTLVVFTTWTDELGG